MAEAIKEIQERKNKVNCMFALIDEVAAKHNITNREDKLQLQFSIYG